MLISNQKIKVFCPFKRFWVIWKEIFNEAYSIYFQRHNVQYWTFLGWCSNATSATQFVYLSYNKSTPTMKKKTTLLNLLILALTAFQIIPNKEHASYSFPPIARRVLFLKQPMALRRSGLVSLEQSWLGNERTFSLLRALHIIRQTKSSFVYHIPCTAFWLSVS